MTHGHAGAKGAESTAYGWFPGEATPEAVTVHLINRLVTNQNLGCEFYFPAAASELPEPKEPSEHLEPKEPPAPPEPTPEPTSSQTCSCPQGCNSTGPSDPVEQLSAD